MGYLRDVAGGREDVETPSSEFEGEGGTAAAGAAAGYEDCLLAFLKHTELAIPLLLSLINL